MNLSELALQKLRLHVHTRGHSEKSRRRGPDEAVAARIFFRRPKRVWRGKNLTVLLTGEMWVETTNITGHKLKIACNSKQHVAEDKTQANSSLRLDTHLQLLLETYWFVISIL